MRHDPSDSLAFRVTRWLAWVAGAAVLGGCGLLITVDVVTRAIFRRGMVESFEISGYALAAAVGLGLAYSVTSRSNIRVDILVERLPTPLRRAADLAAALALALIAAALAWFTFGTLALSWSMDAKSVSTLQTPMVIPQGIWWVGILWFALVAALVPLLAVRALLRRDLARFDRLVGGQRVEDEIAEAGVGSGPGDRPA